MANLNLNDLSKKIAIWLNNFREHGHPPVIDYNQVGNVDILLFWKFQLETIPFLSGPRGHWTEDERDAHFCRILFDVSYFQTLYAIWKKQLRASDLPYFTGRGEPLLDVEHRKIREYIIERGGSPRYPTTDDLKKIANLLKGIRTVRFCERIYQDESLAYCPCAARLLSPVLGVAKYSVHELDVMSRIELVHLMATCFHAGPKCCVHAACQPKQQTTFICDDFLPSARKNITSKVPRRRRSKSASGDFYKPCGSIYNTVEKTLVFMENEMPGVYN